MAIFEFIEGRHKPGRRHSALGNRLPITQKNEALGPLDKPNPNQSTKRAELRLQVRDTGPTCRATSKFL